MRRIGATTPRRTTIVTIRWISLVGQALAIAAAALLFGLQIPFLPCLVVLILGVVVNLVLTASAAANLRLSERESAFALAADVAQTTALLFFAGGLANPFALFLLAPAVVGATVLGRDSALGVSIIAIIAATILFFWRFPLVGADGLAFDPPFEIGLGAYVALVVALIFLPAYARRVSLEAFDMSTALAAAQMALEQQERISAIGAMAAAVAHELGTPLATIKLTATELKRDLRGHAEAAEDAALIVEQAERCREILQGLSAVKTPDDAQIRYAPIMTVLQEAAEPHHRRRARLVYRLNGEPAGPDDPPRQQPEIPRRPELIHGLRNLIQNAADFAASTIWIDVTTAGHGVEVTIGDDGAGFSAEILDRLGEPFATTRGRDRETDAHYTGMGLGVFIAKTLLERTGAMISFENAAAVGGRARRRAPKPTPPENAAKSAPSGAIVHVRWPRTALETLRAGAETGREPERDAPTTQRLAFRKNG